MRGGGAEPEEPRLIGFAVGEEGIEVATDLVEDCFLGGFDACAAVD